MKTSFAAPSTPYKGLAPYGDSDVDAFLFFGRERDRDVIVANLIAARLTVLYGPSGVGKSSVLRAGVAHSLRGSAYQRNGGPEHAIAVVDVWSGDPVGTILAAVDAPREATLALSLAAWTRQHDATLYLILDQFEEYFLYHGDDNGGPLRDELADVLTDRSLRVNVLFSLREDALAQLDAFKGRIPNLFANSLRLDRLDRRAGRSAIVGPVERYDDLVPEDARVEIEPELVEAVLDEVTLGKVELGTAGRGEVPAQEAETSIEAPYLQLVMERLWEAEQAEGSRVLRLGTLRGLGGAVSIVRSHLERALDALTAEQRDVAASVFNHLVTPSGTKIAHRPGDLAEYAAVQESELVPVLGALGRERILRAVDGAASGTARYEIFHDVLGDAVLAWRARHETEQRVAAERARHRRALRLVGVALFGLLAMTAVAVYAIVERGDARDAARRAHARELVARSFASIERDPQRSIPLALEAAALEPALDLEDLLRDALLRARLRRVFRIGDPVSFVAYGPHGTVIAGRRDGLVTLRDAFSGRIDASIRVPAPLVAMKSSGFGAVLAAGGNVVRVRTASGRSVDLRHPARVRSASFARAGSRVVTTSADGGIRIWSLTGALLHVLHGPRGVVLAVIADSAPRVISVARGRGGRVQPRLYDLRTGRLLRVLPQRGVTDAVVSPTGDLFATTSRDSSTSLWRVRDGRLICSFADAGALIDAAFSPDGSLLATAARDGGVRVWTVATGTRLFLFVGHQSPLVRVAFDPHGEFVVSASEDRTARIVKVTGIGAGGEAMILAGHRAPLTDLAIAPSGRTLATASDDGTVRIWSAQLDQELRVVRKQHALHVRFVGARIVATELRPGEVRAPTSTTVAARSPRGDVLAIGDEDGTVTLQSVDGVTLRVLRGHERAVTDVRFDPSGTRLVSAARGSKNNLIEWDVRTGRRLHVLVGHFNDVSAASYSSDGRWILSAGPIAAAIWKVGTERPLFYLRGPKGLLTDAEWASTGYRVATASRDGTIRTYVCLVCAPLDGLVALARTRLVQTSPR